MLKNDKNCRLINIFNDFNGLTGLTKDNHFWLLLNVAGGNKIFPYPIYIKLVFRNYKGSILLY